MRSKYLNYSRLVGGRLWLRFGVKFGVCYRQELLGKELGHKRVNSCRVDQRYEGHVRPLSGQHQGLPRLREKKHAF